MTLINVMLILFLLMFIGFICGKLGVLTDTAGKTISSVVVNIATPAMILDSAIQNAGSIEGRSLLVTFLLSLLMFAVMMLLAHFIPIILRAPKNEYGAFRAMTTFSNIGFMGFPLVSALYGSKALLLAAVFQIPYNVLIYTYGIAVLAPDYYRNNNSVKGTIKKIFNVGVVVCIISIIVYLAQIPMPSAIAETASYLSKLTAPLSMIVIGDSLCRMNLKSLFTNGRLMIFSVIKLLIIPIVGMFLINMMGLSYELTGVCMVMISVPVGSMTAMLAREYEGNWQLPTAGVGLSTILSVLTIPLVSFIIGL